MTTKASRLLDDAMQLSDADRADLATHLIESLDTNVDRDADEAWRVEIDRRLAELESGRIATIPWSEVRERLSGGPNGKSKN